MFYEKRRKNTDIMKTICTARLLFVCTLVASYPATSVHAADSPKLRVAYTAFAGTFTILWVGKDSGLYQKYGADMDLLFIGSSTTAVQALLGGDVDLVYSAAGAVVDANLAGADLVMVGCQYDRGRTSFFTTVPIAGVAALKGKTVGVTRFGAFSDFVARHVLKKFRLQPIKTSLCSNWAALERSSPACKTIWSRADRFLCRSRCKRVDWAFANCSLRKPLRCRLITVASS